MSEALWVAGATAAEQPAAERRSLAIALAPDSGDRVLVDTCHRVELYGVGEPPPLARSLGLRRGAEAARHLLRVAAGLESAVVGEDEVLHQVRQSLESARAGRALDPRLHRLFEVAVATGRLARSGRAAAGAGLAGRAIAWLEERTPLRARPVVVAGAGRMGSALAHQARKRGAVVTVASRDVDRARRLAAVYEGDGVDLAEGARRAGASAAVAVALGGPWKELALLQGPLPPFADLSAPTALPGEVRGRLNGSFLGVDDLFETGGVPPPGYVASAETVVAGKLADYLRWLEARS